MYQPEQPIFDEQPESNIEVTIGISDVPKPWWKSWYFALQITLVDFTPFMWVSGFASLAGIQSAHFTATMLSACFFCMGICTFIQTTIGNRLPIVQGTSSSLMSAMGNIAGVYGLPATWGSILLGGFLEFLLGATRIISKIRKFLPPVVLGSVVTSIGFVAARIAVQWTFSNTEPIYMVLAVIAFILALLLKFLGKGIVSQGFILISVVLVGVAGASVLGLFDWQAVKDAPWFAFPQLFPFRDMPNPSGESGQLITFVGAAILGGFSGYIGSIFESVGDYGATCAACKEVYRVKHIDRGIMAEGLGCVITAFFGALPCTSYTQNIGIVAATGVASRRVTQVAGVLFLLYGLCPKMAYVLAGIPKPIIGAVFLITAASIMFSGIDTIVSSPRTLRNTIIAGTTLSVAVMLPYHCSSTYAEWASSLPPFLNMVCTSNVFLAVIFGVGLNIILNIILKDKSTNIPQNEG